MSVGLDQHNAAILRAVVEETAEATGRAFFRSLVRSLAGALGVRYCFVTECLDQPPSRVRTLAFWAGDGFAEEFEYALMATPCEKVVAGEACLYGTDIQALFEDDEDLVTLGADSYAAVPLLESHQTTLGHLAVLDDKPFPERAPDLPLLQLFAARAAAEISRQRATVQLAQSEARLRQVIDLVPHYIFAKDHEGRFTLCNQAVADALGTSLDNLIGKTDADFSATPEEAESFRRDDMEVLRSGQSRVIDEETVTDAEGRQHTLRTTKIPFTSAGTDEPSLLGIAIDVTEERRLQKRFRSLVEGTAGAFGDAFFHSLTQRLAEAFGTRYAILAEVEEGQVIARAVWAGDRHIPGFEYPLQNSPGALGFREQKVAYHSSDLRRRFPDSGLLQHLEAESYLGTPLVDAERRPIGLLAVLDTKPLEDAAEDRNLLAIFASRAAAELEREGIERQRHKLQAQLLHVQKLESLGVLAGGIAHDFNNLLSAILGNLDLAVSTLGEDSPAAPFLEGIESAAQRSAELAHQMLAYSGKGRFVVESLNVNQLIENMLPLLSTSISKKALIELDLATDLERIRGDATQLRQVAMNLIINASDAIGDHPGTIRIRTGTRQADRNYLSQSYLDEHLMEGEYLFLEVEDDGSGMDKETRERLFDPFFTTKATGRGLGLAALLGIVRGHQGAVRVRSVPGQGSTFTILLPLNDGTQQETVPEDRGREWLAGGEGCVLFADDEELLREVGRSALEGAGFEVLMAHNGRQAVDLFQQRSGDIVAVILDMMMPEMDGLETFRELRRIKPTIKGVLASGYSNQAVSESYDEAGLHGFLKKPYRPEHLTSMVASLLES